MPLKTNNNLSQTFKMLFLWLLIIINNQNNKNQIWKLCYDSENMAEIGRNYKQISEVWKFLGYWTLYKLVSHSQGLEDQFI